MIFDKIENISDYFEELPLLKKVEDFVVDFKNGKLADGTYEIDGKRVFGFVYAKGLSPAISGGGYGGFYGNGRRKG